VQIDPEYALAYTGIADSFSVMGFYGAIEPRQAFEKAEIAARRALQIDPNLAEAHCSLSFPLLHYHWDWPAAEGALQRALELNPNCALAYHWYGFGLTVVGRLRDGLTALEGALEFDPLSAPIQAHIGRLFYFARKYDLAVARLRAAIELEPGYAPARYFLGMTYVLAGQISSGSAELRQGLKLFGMHPAGLAALAFAAGANGRRAEARETIARMQALSQHRRVPAFFVAFGLASFAEPDEIFEWLEKAYVERFPWLLYLKSEPAFDRVRTDPRMSDLIQRVDPLLKAAAGA
jgi:tetratricopeptide (TPR) repeat protein